MAYVFYNAMSNTAKNPDFEIQEKDKNINIAVPLGVHYDPEQHYRQIPNYIQQVDRKKIIYDTLSYNLHVMIAAQPVMDVIERFEPGVHEFIPLEVRNKKGEVIDGPYFIINPQQVFCAILADEVEEHRVKWTFATSAGPVVPRAMILAPEYTLSRPKIAGRHL